MRRAILALCAGLGACASLGLDRAGSDPHVFLQDLDVRLRELYLESGKAAWVQATHITEDTQWLAARARQRTLDYLSQAALQARSFDVRGLEPQTVRQLELLQLSSAAPTDPDALAEMTSLRAGLTARYGSGRYCPPGSEEGDAACLPLSALEDIMRDSRDPTELLQAWSGWREVAPAMRDDYARFVELKNAGARELGFSDTGAFWRAQYDMPVAAFEQEVDRLWQQVRPLYESLHCLVRAELRDDYGSDLVPADGSIPAHLLGNMWAQQWEHLYPRLVPYPEAVSLDVTAGLQRQNYDAVAMVRQAEGFYRSLGLPALPESFYERSLFVKPRDREVVCHASAWDIDQSGDVRIKMCIEPDEEDLRVIYHELGHIYYDLAYNPLPLVFQSGAHDGFHEAVGDTVMLSLMTPDYLQSVGLIEAAGSSTEALINQQLKMALDKVAFLPFGLLVDKWRWQVFSGEVGPEQYNEAWWSLREQYQGISAPNQRPPNAFDPGAKYHIPANTPYMRYFLAHVMQFQFYAALCEAAGHEGALHSCNFAGSKAAGAQLWAGLQAGQSQPWQDTMQILTGSSRMDASALLEYFAPLRQWLDEQNAGRSCGW